MASSGLDTASLADAVRGGRLDIVGIAHEVGASGARLGVPLAEVLDLVERAYAPETPDVAAVRAAAVGWSEITLLHHTDISCENPLTSLATIQHLRTRLAEIYRGAEQQGLRVGDAHALVVVELPRSSLNHELELALRALDVADVLRVVFAGAETFVQLTSRRFAVLVIGENADDLTMRLLALLLDRMVTDHGQPRLWIERLPSTADGIAQVLASLSE